MRLDSLKKIGNLPVPTMGGFLGRFKSRVGNSHLADALHDKKDRMAQRLGERLMAFWWRLEVRWATFGRRLTGTSRHMAAGIAHKGDILESGMKRLFPVFSQALHSATHPVRWMRQDRRRGMAAAGTLFALSLGILIIRLGGPLQRDRNEYANRYVLLYDLGTGRLKAYPPGTRPGTNGSAGIMIYTSPNGPQPQAGMTLEDLQKAGMVVGWLFRLDTADWTGQYAAPDQLENWISEDSKGFKKWLAHCQYEVQKHSGGNPLVPCANRVGDAKKASAK